MIAGPRWVAPIGTISFRCSMAACISVRFEVSGSCKNTSGMSSKVMKLMRNFGLIPQRREGKKGRAGGRKGEREGGEGVRK